MKKAIFCLLLLATPILALNYSTDIYTPEDVNFSADINAGGNVTVNIDGTNIGEAINETSTYITEHESEWSRDVSGVNYNKVIRTMLDALTYILGNGRVSDGSEQIGNLMSVVFIPRPELDQIFYQYEVRIQALENTMDKIAGKEYCRGKIDVMIEHNLTSVTCQNTTWHNKFDGTAVGITPIE